LVWNLLLLTGFAILFESKQVTREIGSKRLVGILSPESIHLLELHGMGGDFTLLSGKEKRLNLS